LPCSVGPGPSELQSGVAGGVGEGGDPAVVEVAASVEDDLGDAGGLGPLGDELPTLAAASLLPVAPAEVGLVVDAAARVRRRGRRSPGR
jgi:hypothetical protein